MNNSHSVGGNRRDLLVNTVSSFAFEWQKKHEAVSQLSPPVNTGFLHAEWPSAYRQVGLPHKNTIHISRMRSKLDFYRNTEFLWWDFSWFSPGPWSRISRHYLKLGHDPFLHIISGLFFTIFRHSRYLQRRDPTKINKQFNKYSKASWIEYLRESTATFVVSSVSKRTYFSHVIVLVRAAIFMRHSSETIIDSDRYWEVIIDS